VSFEPTSSSPWHRLASVPRWPVPEHYNVVEEACDRHPPDKLAMIWDDDQGTVRHVFWRELQERSSRFSAALVARGVLPGDRVVMILRQSPETAAAILGVLKTGAVLVTMSDLLADRVIGERVGELEAKALVTETRFADRFDRLVPGATLLLDRFEFTGFSGRFQTVKTPAESLAFIAYTSGTTGTAKGVMLPHRVMIAGDETRFVQDLRDGERYYGIGEWSWWVRKILGPWQCGAVNLCYRHERYDPERLLRTLARHEVTNAFINATAIRVMMRDRTIGRRCPVPLRVASSSNEPLGVEASDWFHEQFGVRPVEFYGCTEVGILIGGSPHVPIKPGAMGTVIPGYEVRVLDDEGREVPRGAEGEICLLARSSPNWPLGYWRRPEDSERDFGGQWFRTKDIASMDADGHLWYVGRRDDVIKSAGYRIGPHDVEATLRRHPQVQDAAVIGVPDPERGATVVAYVVLQPGADGTPALVASLQDLVRAEYSAFGYPREVRFVADLPRSSTGKTDRKSLRLQHGPADMHPPVRGADA